MHERMPNSEMIVFKGLGHIHHWEDLERFNDVTTLGGWIMVQEESPKAEVDPNTATVKNGEYLRRSLLPIV